METPLEELAAPRLMICSELLETKGTDRTRGRRRDR